MRERPDYVTCVEHTHEERKGTAWCGRRVTGFRFVGLDHAAYNALASGRLVACPECVAAAVKALRGDDA